MKDREIKEKSQEKLHKLVQYLRMRLGNMPELFVPANEEERGCQMWGVCDLPDEDGDE